MNVRERRRVIARMLETPGGAQKIAECSKREFLTNPQRVCDIIIQDTPKDDIPDIACALLVAFKIDLVEARRQVRDAKEKIFYFSDMEKDTKRAVDNVMKLFKKEINVVKQNNKRKMKKIMRGE